MSIFGMSQTFYKKKLKGRRRLTNDIVAFDKIPAEVA